MTNAQTSEMPVAVRSMLDVSVAAATPSFRDAVLTLNRQRADLSVELARDLQMPVEASVHVPVSAQVLKTDEPHRLNITLAAAVTRDYYPHFRGSIELQQTGPAACALVLQGQYTVPLGRVGHDIDVTFMRDVAARSLQRFTDTLANEIARRIREPV